MFCQVCGAGNDDNARFCTNCGADLAAQNTTQPENDNIVYSETQVVNEQPQEPVYTQPQEPVYTQPQEPVYNYAPVEEPANTNDGKGMATASLICGILSFFCCPFVASILAIIFGAVAKKKGYKGGMATGGIVCGVIGLVLAILLIVVIILMYVMGFGLAAVASTPTYYY